MMRHLPFLKMLAKAADVDHPMWRDVAPGYLMLRFFDRWMDEGPAIMSADPAFPALQGRIRSTDTLPASVRDILLDVLERLVSAPDHDPVAAIDPLLAYAGYLHSAGQTSLSAHIYRTIGEMSAGRAGDPDARIAHALTQYGFTSHLLGRLEIAEDAYTRAEEIAADANDTVQLLCARLGRANVLNARGSLAVADTTLTQVIVDASAHALCKLEARALHARGATRTALGQFDNAIRDYYRAYEMTNVASDRDVILRDLAACEVEAGYRAEAREAHQLLAYTATAPDASAVAWIHVIELAILDNDRVAFDIARRDFTAGMSRTAISAERGARAALAIARGVERFEGSGHARPAYRTAAAKAKAAKLPELELEASRRSHHIVANAPAVGKTSPAVAPPDCIRDITNAIAAATRAVCPQRAS